MSQFTADIWSVDPEEKAKHGKVFQSLNPMNGKISGEQSKKYFMKSNLPTPMLGQIWSLSDLDKDGRMTLQEFTIAMHLISCKLKGVEIPRTLPASLKTSTSASHHGFPSGPTPLQPMGGQILSMGGPMQPMMMNGNFGGMIQPMQSSGMFGMGGMQPSLGMQPTMGMQQPAMGMQPGMGMQQAAMNMNFSGGFSPAPGQISRVGSAPVMQGFGGPVISSHQSSTLPSNSSQNFGTYNKPSGFSSNMSGGISKGPNSNSLDSLAIDSLSGFKGMPSGASTLNKQGLSSGGTLGSISAPNRLKYTQMFKATDHEMTGYLSGEHARQILIQSNVDPQMLAQIWELSDVNKDGKLELDEFIIAMHLIDSTKIGITLPLVLPADLITPNLRNSSAAAAMGNDGRGRASSISDVQITPVNFEDRRKMNWDKGQMELQRRRKEIQDRQQKEKDERERKEREEEDRKRKIREEAERRRQQEIENDHRQKEEMEKEQELLRKKMIEQRLAAQLEAERQRQIEWEKRRKEELLNQKGHEENIVNELKSRLEKLKDNLLTETTNRDSLSKTYELKKAEGIELHVAIERLNKSRDNRLKDITRLQTELQESKSKLANLIEEREKYTVELNQKDSSTTSEALGAIRSSARQMKMGMERLRKNLISIEAETASVLKDSNKISEQHKELRVRLHEKMSENRQLKQQCELKKREEFERRRAIDVNRQKLEAYNKNQLELRGKLEADMKKQKEKEEEAMRKEKQIQEASQKQRQDARNAGLNQQNKLQIEAALQNQQTLLKSRNEIVKNQQESPVSTPKAAAPPRPRSRPHGSLTPQSSGSLFSIDFSKITDNKKDKNDENGFAADFNPSQTNEKAFTADFSALSDVLFDADFSQSKPKKPPPRPAAPAIIQDVSIEPQSDTKKKQKEDEKNRKEEEKKRKKDEEAAKKKEDAKKKADEAEKKRLEKEKEEIERLKNEQAAKDLLFAAKLQKEEEERVRKEQEEQKEQDKIRADSAVKEEERKRKEAEVKRKVEEMQRKRMEKKNAATPKAKPTPDRPSVAPAAVVQYVKKTAYKMMFAFEARNPDELTVTEGDIVQVNENDDTAPAGWFRGTMNGVTGLFPSNYASKLENDTFSDYVDLDPRANVVQEKPKPIKPQQPQTRKASASNELAETKAETLPKLRPVKKPEPSTPSNKGQRPKSALLPTSILKKLQPTSKSGVKQRKTTENNDDLFPRYDYVVGPVQASTQDDIYAVPVKSKSFDNIVTAAASSQEATTVAFPDDLYQVPGEILAAQSGMGESIQAIALYPYRATKDDHLSFDKNDYINVQQQQGQWWFGECNGNSGWFPKSYVKPIGAGNARKPSQANEPAQEAKETMQQITEKQSKIGECVALFDYSGQAGDLAFNEGDIITVLTNEGEWWEGCLNGITGAFPANYVKMKEHEIIVNQKPELAQVTVKYTATSEGEISLNVGQLVHVLQKNSNGWWQGELQIRGKNKPKGWFPESHVKLKVKQESSAGATTPVAALSAPVEHRQEDIYSVPMKIKEEQVLAMFSYTAQNEDELTFFKGSVIKVVSKDGDWWKGELDGLVGVFPFNYVQELQSDMQETTSQWSGAFESTLLKSMSKTERQRQNHIYELINTEQDYLNDLSLTLEVFYNPLAEASILTDQELNTVFINWKELIMCNMKFLKALLVRKKMSETDKIEGIGDIIVEQLPRFSPYIRFCSCMLKACRLLQEKVEKDAEFKTFEKKCAGDPRLKQNLPLSSYLLKPLQRITKYPLVITNILKYTPEDHFDRDNLLLGLERSEDLCVQVNEGVRSQENSNRLEWLQERVNLEGLEENLVFNSQTNCLGQRKYIRHGNLHKHKSNKELKAFLFNDFLLLCRAHNGTSVAGLFHPDNDTKLTIYKKPIFLNEVIVKSPTDPDVNNTLFHLSHIDRVYSFRSDTKNERNAWVSTIQKSSQLFIETERDKRNRATRARSLGESEVGRLVVTIIEGAQLNASDPTGTSDPYCEVSMGSQEHRTKVIPKDLNPKWNSTMVFNIKDLDKDVLCISVFDRDFFSPNDFLGRTEVSVSSIMGQGKGPITKRLLLHEVATGEIVVTLELQNLKFL